MPKQTEQKVPIDEIEAGDDGGRPPAPVLGGRARRVTQPPGRLVGAEKHLLARHAQPVDGHERLAAAAEIYAALLNEAVSSNTPSTSDSRKINSSSPLRVMSVPEYLANRTRSRV